MQVGWIGTGIMGSSMCRHLIEHGHSVKVTSRTASRAKPLLDLGAHWATEPAEVAADAEVVFAMVGFPSEVRQVFLGPGGVITGSRAGLIAVDMATSPPELELEIAQAARARGAEFLDAPVSGGDVGAQQASLSIMVGGDAAAFARVLPLFECMGKTIVHQGPVSTGQHAKMVNQILIATGMIGVCEALLYAQRAGLDAENVLAAVGSGAAASWSLSNLGPRILRGDFEPGFLVEHFVKDLGIALDEARRMNLCLPGLALAEQLYLSVSEQGYRRKGITALMLALEKMSSPGPK